MKKWVKFLLRITLHIRESKLYLVRFEKERKRIETLYDDMERQLIEEFVTAQRKDDFTRMKEIAQVLSNFKGYSQCVDAYIEYSQTVSLI